MQSLKETIERLHGLPANNQVLLISGGEILQDGSRVCSYSSGTDTNPIYMFSTSFLEKNSHQSGPSIESGKFFDIISKIVCSTLLIYSSFQLFKSNYLNSLM